MATEPLPAHLDPLTIHAPIGEVPHIQAPIPRWTAVVLSAFLAVEIREWLEMGDGGLFTLCGHQWKVHAWHDGAGALIVKHACCL